MMGTGVVAVDDFIESLRLVRDQIEPDTELRQMPFVQQAGILGLALTQLLEQGMAPHSGVGLQAVSLSPSGVEQWTISSSSVEFKERPREDPTCPTKSGNA